MLDSGQRTFKEFLAFLDKADRFKGWMKQVNPDEGLVATYIKDVSTKGWVESLEGKTLRYILTTALGATGPLAGLVGGFIDTFLLDRLIQGWRPNHFVDSRYAPFLVQE